MKNKRFLIIGLGQFGISLTKNLLSLGHNVTAIEKNLKKVQEYSTILSLIYHADSTNEQFLKVLEVQKYHHVIVALGNEQQASLLTTLILKDLDAIEITAQSTNDLHSRILKKIGAHRVIQPESDAGVKLAHQFTSLYVHSDCSTSQDDKAQ